MTEDEIRAAYRSLEQQGTAPTNRAVRAALGDRGSLATIFRVVHRIRAEREELGRMRDQLPDPVRERIEALMAEVWRAAEERASAQVRVAVEVTERERAYSAELLAELEVLEKRAEDADRRAARAEADLAEPAAGRARPSAVVEPRQPARNGADEGSTPTSTGDPSTSRAEEATAVAPRSGPEVEATDEEGSARVEGTEGKDDDALRAEKVRITRVMPLVVDILRPAGPLHVRDILGKLQGDIGLDARRLFKAIHRRSGSGKTFDLRGQGMVALQ